MNSDDPSSVFDTRRRDRDQKSLAVLNAAAGLFLTRGYHKTRMDDIANALGITKPALYNYFKSKHEILFACHMLGHDIIDDSMDEIEAAKGGGVERLQALIKAYAGIMTEKFGMCLVRLDEHELTPKQFAEVGHRRRLVNDRFESYLRMAIAEGDVPSCDVKLTIFSITGALNWISRWFAPGGRMNSEQLSNHYASELTRSLKAPRVDSA
jgi:AcrR family transcriptional regulator